MGLLAWFHSQALDDSKWFNEAELLEFFDNDAEVSKLVVESFLQSTPKSIQELEDSCVAKNEEGIRCCTHTLKSAIGCIKSERVFSLILEMHDRARIGDIAFAIDHMAEFKSNYKKLEQLLNSYLKR